MPETAIFNASDLNHAELLAEICAITQAAGEIILTHYAGKRESRAKADKSPVTDADIEANQYIIEKLAQITPDIAIVSEESALPELGKAQRFWLVDPLDGTKSYIKGTGEFTVNIGLIEQGKAVMGAVYIPVPALLYAGCIGHGAYRQEGKGGKITIEARLPPAEGLAVVKSMSHDSPLTDSYLKDKKVASKISASSSMKFCRVAEGEADLYPRFGRTMEWDTAAGHAVLAAAGGAVETADGKPFLYGKPGFENPHFIAFGKR